MEVQTKNNLDKVLIVGLTPYFLEKPVLWFEQNLKQISEARKTQSWWQDNTLILEKNQSFNLSQLLRKLDEMGYERVWQVSEIGEFSQRGGIVDIFPVNLSFAVRVEFFGNKLESLELMNIKVENLERAKEILKKKLKSQKLFSNLKGLKSGDYLVHLDHGIGRFAGIKHPVSSIKHKKQEDNTKYKIPNTKYYILEYAEGDKLYIPIGLERKLSKYIGFAEPKISRLGSPLWLRKKRKVKQEAEKLAKELLEIYAKREVATRPAYSPSTEIDSQLISTFPYNETPDQIQAMKEIEKDLAKNQPMDRLICGDVGFGKTEIALRAMVRAVNSGYQAAMICPTTILSNQHFQNFKQRLKKLPLRVALLSRLQSKKEQQQIIQKLKTGEIDIVVGTHRLLSKDVEFKKLGLLVVDDEQRFGVRQKEKFRKMRASIDILSLSATPIPRTLYLTLSSLKEVSLIQTPPIGRVAVKTFVLPWSRKVIKKAIENEISRGGQIYFLHNRVETMPVMRRSLEKIYPRAKIGIAHGSLKEKRLVKVMEEFQNQKIDLLLATTIIENGLDLPNVNTLIVADSTKLGLAQAYQLRGRVGRSHIQAFAYFLYEDNLSEIAKMRLETLKEANELGSGYKVALRDLEIRGAGNILGKEQSGNINAVGLNLYCQILSEAVEKLKSK